MKISKGYNKAESGQSLIEFALILPILLGLVLGIVEFGWVIMAKVSVNNAAREVARAYVVGTSADISIDRGVDLIDHLTITGVNTKEDYRDIIDISPESPSDGDTVTVTITGNLEAIVGFFGNSFNIDTTAHMRMENTP